MRIRLEAEIANKDLTDIHHLEHHECDELDRFDVTKRLKKKYGKRLLSVMLNSTDHEMNSNFVENSPAAALYGIYGGYHFNTLKD